MYTLTLKDKETGEVILELDNVQTPKQRFKSHEEKTVVTMTVAGVLKEENVEAEEGI